MVALNACWIQMGHGLRKSLIFMVLKSLAPEVSTCLDNDELRAPSNLMLLCLKHHKIIDGDATTYTVEYLQIMKQQHEDKFRKGINEIERLIGLTTQTRNKVPCRLRCYI